MPESRFPKEFTRKLLANLLKSQEFCLAYRDLIVPEVFTNPLDIRISRAVFTFLDDYKRPPLFNELRYILNRSIKNDEERQACLKRVDSIEDEPLDNARFITDEIIEFGRRTTLLSAASEASKLATYDDSTNEDLADVYRKALSFGDNIGKRRELILDATSFELWQEHYKTRPVIKTGFRFIDGSLHAGGIAEGELLLILAPPKSFKTALLIDLAVKSLLNGLDVFYITLEISRFQIYSRFLTNLLGFDIRDLRRLPNEVRQKVLSLKDEIDSRLTIIEYPSKRTPIQTIERRIESEARRPRVVIVDHAKILQPLPYKDARVAVGGLISVLQGVARDVGFTCYSAWHSNRLSWDIDLVEKQHVADASIVIEDVDLAITLSQTPEERDMDPMIIRANIDASRIGLDGIVTPLKIMRPSYRFVEVEEDGS